VFVSETQKGKNRGEAMIYTKQQKRLDRWYGADAWASDSLFLKFIEDSVNRDSWVLDAGAGSGEAFSHDLRHRVCWIIAVDKSLAVLLNWNVNEAVVRDVSNLPPDWSGRFDVVFARYLFEHLEKPDAVLSEIHRVLAPGGRVIFLTPNRWHYVSLVARFTPLWFHRWFNTRIRGKADDETFPTYYRLNSVRAIRCAFAKAGFMERKIIRREPPPAYLLWSAPAFYAGLLYERIVNALPSLAGLRAHIIGLFWKGDNK
jgi:SAM-dependent methyltransferase